MLQTYLSLLDTQADRDKFTVLYRQYRDLMFYIAQKYLESDADREIAVDAALHALLPAMDRIDDPLSARTKNLAALVTKNKCIDLLRKRGAVKEEELDEAAERILSPKPQGTESLADAIASMSETGRELILLRYYHGYTTTEIGMILDISWQASRKRLERAKAELKAILEEEG